jgi:putative lipoic acid-binding regulatory protein
MTQPNGHDKTSPIQFPCDFMLKVMGKAQGEFESTVLAIVMQHFPTVDLSRMHKKFSQNNHYLSLSITVYAESKAQLDALYLALSGNPTILMVL